MAVTTKSGRGGNAPTSNGNVEETQEEVNPSREYIIDILELVVRKAKAPLAKPPPPYPESLAKKNGENRFMKFIQMIKDLSINVSLSKLKLTTTPIITSPNWSLPFELMCDASDVAVGAILGQRINKVFHLIYFASKTMNNAQVNYTIMEKELLAIVFLLRSSTRT
ncbi:PREDICTED: uncharacterized protein LOC109230356 [Nicotiana attenuata]|uniref:uncharacterized protein LOC109230356 n=1 Tax=Nicotiana attenuata TaxID=49451 RepID=UPI000905C65A|nr:PREDICTED: uncharacterized protein LOC109230356 [Nicotiana attenuata]